MIRDTGNYVANGDPPDNPEDVRAKEDAWDYWAEVREIQEREKQRRRKNELYHNNSRRNDYLP